MTIPIKKKKWNFKSFSFNKKLIESDEEEFKVHVINQEPEIKPKEIKENDTLDSMSIEVKEQTDHHQTESQATIDVISELQNQLAISQSHIKSIDAENNQLYLCIQDFEERDQFYKTMNDRLEGDLSAAQSDIKKLSKEITMKQDEIGALQTLNLHLKKQLQKQDHDFEMFSSKIRQQQIVMNEMEKEIDDLRLALRGYQFEPFPTDSKLKDALYDVEALKLLVNDLKLENEQLKEQKNHERWATVTEDRAALLKKFRSNVSSPTPIGENNRSIIDNPSKEDKLNAAEPPKTPSKIGFQNNYTLKENPLLWSTKSERTDHSTIIRSPTPIKKILASPSEYYKEKEHLEDELKSLAEEKLKLQFELGRIPSQGHKAMQRKEEVENELDNIDHLMATTRKQMREYGFL